MACKHGETACVCPYCDNETVLIYELLSLLTPDLDIYTVVVMARRDLQADNFDSAISRLKVDADKLRMHSKPLYEFINRF